MAELDLAVSIFMDLVYVVLGYLARTWFKITVILD